MEKFTPKERTGGTTHSQGIYSFLLNLYICFVFNECLKDFLSPSTPSSLMLVDFGIYFAWCSLSFLDTWCGVFVLWKILSHFPFIYFFYTLLSFFSTSRDSNYTYFSTFDIVWQFWILLSPPPLHTLLFSSLCLPFADFSWPILKFTDSFLGFIKSNNESDKGVFYLSSYCVFLILHSTWSLHRISMFVLELFIRPCI